jgi:hypothetical protein
MQCPQAGDLIRDREEPHGQNVTEVQQVEMKSPLPLKGVPCFYFHFSLSSIKVLSLSVS